MNNIITVAGCHIVITGHPKKITYEFEFSFKFSVIAGLNVFVDFAIQDTLCPRGNNFPCQACSDPFCILQLSNDTDCIQNHLRSSLPFYELILLSRSQ